MSIPRAPGLGLLLKQPVFHEYNRKVSLIREKQNQEAAPNDDGNAGPATDVVEFESVTSELKAFQEEYIYRSIQRQESQDATWVSLVCPSSIYS